MDESDVILKLLRGKIMRKCMALAFILAVSIFMTGSAGATAVYWGVSGHWYERVETSGITWTDANTAARNKGGHLVAITSAAENLFLTNNIKLGDGSVDKLHFFWTGGYQLSGSSEPDGGWSWVTGETFSYSNWCPGEPNDSGGNENYIIFDHGFTGDGKMWNDIAGSAGACGYVVEYDKNPVPVPPTILLLGTGIAGMTGFRLRRKS